MRPWTARCAATMTAPTFASLTTLLTGWVFARRRTVTRMILAVGDAAEKHFSSYHRLFSAARWSLDALGLAVLDLMQPFLGSVILLGLDDTLARKRGVKMFFTSKGPSSRRRQPPLKPDEKAILRKKLLKFIDKGYLAPHVGRIESLIKYFAIPKGVIEGVVQDWRIVFDAGANELNECVWAPLT